MKKNRCLKMVSSILFMMTVMMLCSACNLKKESYVKREVKKLFPHAKCISVIEEETDPGYPSKTYTFQYKDIVFDVINYTYKESYFGYRAESSYTTYWEKMLEKEDANIKSIISKYGLDADVVANNAGFGINVYVDEIGDIERAILLVEELNEDLNDYLPVKVSINEEGNQINYLPAKVTVSFLSEGTEKDYFTFYKDNSVLGKDRKTWMKKKDYATYFYEQAIVTEKIPMDVTAKKEVANHQPLFLENLYINGQKYVSDRYETQFMYDAAKGTYMAPVIYGIQVEYNGGVDDYLQRELITTYYPDSNYEIQYETGSKKTTYQIGSDHYEMKRNDRSEMVTIKKNGTVLDIPYERYDYIDMGGASANATYIGYVTISDYADLMHMKVTKIDTENLAVYLETID